MVQFCPNTYEVQNHLLLGLVHALDQLLWLLSQLLHRSRALLFLALFHPDLAIRGVTIKV
jgi:hypothetical protein